MGDEYECEVTDEEGLLVDETRHIIVLFKANYYLYLYLSIACFFSCIGGPLPLCRIFSGCCHCIGAFVHVGVLVYTGLVRFRWAKDCFVEGEEGDPVLTKEMKEDGAFLYNTFIA